MTKPYSTIYRYIVRELAPTEHEPDEAAITIVCEPLSGLPAPSSMQAEESP